MRTRPALTTFTLAALSLGCRGAESERSGFLVKDSAGVAIVENTEGVWSTSEGWQVDSIPSLVIPGDSTLNNPRWVADAVRLENGSIAVLLEHSARIFDSAGRLIGNAGGEGDGPGEFRYTRAIIGLPGDSLLIFAGGPRGKVAIFGSTGQLIRDETFDFGKFHGLGRWQECNVLVLPNRSRIGCQADSTIPLSATNRPSQMNSQGMTSPGPGFLRQLRRVHLTSPTMDTSYPLGIDIGTERVQVGVENAQFVIHPFHARSLIAFGGTPLKVVTMANPEYRIEVWTPTGKLERVILRRGGRNAPTQAEIAEAGGLWQTGGVGPESLAAEDLAKLPVPDSLPGGTVLDVGPNGHIFLQRNGYLPSAPIAIDVFQADGRFLGTLTLPRGFRMTDASETHLVGVRRDADDVPRVEVYRINGR